MKRLVDSVLIVASAPVWVPILVLTAGMVWLIEGRPIFFSQERAGFKGKPFCLTKFRSMRLGEGTDAERLTRFGRFLRASSLDELPELFCVLRGEMALVGPRPLPTRYLPRYTAEQMRRHEVLPGITGWAQVNGRNLLTWDEKFKLDVWYVDNHSLWLDVKILFRTIGTTLLRRGISHAKADTMLEFTGSSPTPGK